MPAAAPSRLPAGITLLITLLGVALLLGFVDLSPKVDSDFFFATDDPRLAHSQEIEATFPSTPQILISLEATPAADLRSEAYRAEVEELTSALEQLDGVSAVQSIVRGPLSPAAAYDGPFWKRLLIAPAANASYLMVQLAPDADANGNTNALAAATEKVVRDRHDIGRASISGVPYVIELIRRSLDRDLRWFSLAALLVFGLATAWLFRSGWVVTGTLSAALLACTATLALLALLGKPIGLLTANLATLVFVLTLSHLVFLTAAWTRRRSQTADETARESAGNAVRETFGASFWCMVTTLLGFLSLLFASARPLRELGLAGAVGTLVAIAVAYGVYPIFLRAASTTEKTPSAVGGNTPGQTSKAPARLWPALVYVGIVVIAAFGLPRLITDPGLLRFFDSKSELGVSLERLDAEGGSSPLSIIVGAPNGGRIDSTENFQALTRLHTALEEDSQTGLVLSPWALVAEAKAVPFLAFMPPDKVLDLLAGENFQKIANLFVAEDRSQALFILRMRESGRDVPRAEVLERLRQAVVDSGLEPDAIGGLYELQGALAEVVSGSVIWGLSALTLLFAGIAWWVSRDLRTTAAMVVSLATVPIFILGVMGLLRMPLDLISAPAANVAIALGIDSMIHLARNARRLRQAGLSKAAAWLEARALMLRPILSAALLLVLGFGIFALSSFPPTRRFGLAVVLGTSAATVAALWLLPRLVGGEKGRS